MRARWALALGAAVGALGCEAPPAPEPAADPVATASSEPRPERRKRKSIPQPVIAEGDLDRAFEALSGTAGVGWIACELGMAPGGTVLVEGLDRVEIDGSVLRALVDAPVGAVAVAPADGEGAYPDPVAVLSWTAADPGRRGRCTVEEPKFIVTRLTFVDPGGAAIERDRIAPVGGCWGLDQPSWDGAGGLRVRSIDDVRCRPWVQVLGDGDPEDHQPEFVGGEARAELVLGPSTLGGPSVAGGGVSKARIDAALAREGLPDGARAVLERWAEAAPNTVEDALGALAPR